MGGRFNHGYLENALAITDTTEHLSSSINPTRAGGTLILAAESSLNQDVTIRYQAKNSDSATWFNLGTAVVLSNGDTRLDSLTDPWTSVRVRSICAVAPASGSLTVTWAWEEAV